ncbi:MAG TPA: amino acid adenylation domain-containing protein [Terriglobia bacterium]|jgi:amino acid adenylation domain-containing protein|nr:amino acid adenylation domain-containing protein [Terriglobia bacterium]
MAYLLNHLLTRSAGRYPERPAIWARGRSLTYAELEERSNQLAHLLRERGLAKGDRVGLFFPKSVESLVAMFGVLKAGGVYVALDPGAPAGRIEYIVQNCGIRGLVTVPEKLRTLDPREIPSVEFCLLADEGATPEAANQIPWAALSGFTGSRPPEPRQPTTLDLAYIIYTSGSTGRPKGVMLTHQNALTFVQWCADEFGVTPEDRLSNHAPLHFDLSVFDVYNAIEAGACVTMIPEDVQLFPASLTRFIVTQGISIWYSVPSALVFLVLHGRLGAADLSRLRIILFAGEVFPMKYLRQLAELVPQAALYNLYGPTETNVCTYYKVDRAALAAQERLPIGRSCLNTEVFAVDDQDRVITEPGVEGELYVRGPCVTPGYWGDPEKTHKMVVPNRFQPHFEENLYRTGDLVRLRAEGDYDFLGRRDSQIKSRGYRIELGEIEAVLLAHVEVREAAVVAVPDEEIGARLRAFVTTHNGSGLEPAELQQHCAAKLPHYMIPERIQLREAMPKTSTGKIDRVRLASES